MKKKHTHPEKRGVEMSLNVIVTAAIILLVAIILVYLVSQGLIPIGKFVTSCEDKGGQCSDIPCKELGQENIPSGAKWCQKERNQEYCCYSILESNSAG